MILMIEIKDYIHELNLKERIWHSLEIEKISYPNDGNNKCYEIEDQSFWFKNRNRIVIEVITKYSNPGPIFDVGGGNGFVSNYLGKSGFEAVLVEPGIDGCLNARKSGLKYIINSNFDTTHFYPNSIPNICIFDVLEHVENQYQFLKTIYTNLIPDGRLFITVPSFYALWSEEDKLAGHFRRYRIKELKKVMDEHGFDVLYASYFFSFLVLPIFLLRTIPSIFGFYRISSEQTKSQHLSNSRKNNLLDKLMKCELMRVKKSKSIIIGSSLLLVARKR
jgi:2-polyprenyl-3-methyl-5-hydroxy-6-metoxy-1,4-benzoquinol methylase